MGSMEFKPDIFDRLFKHYDPGYRYECKDNEHTWQSSDKLVWLQVSLTDGRIYFSVSLESPYNINADSRDYYIDDDGLRLVRSIAEEYLKRLDRFYVFRTERRGLLTSRVSYKLLLNKGEGYYDLTKQSIEKVHESARIDVSGGQLLKVANRHP